MRAGSAVHNAQDVRVTSMTGNYPRFWRAALAVVSVCAGLASGATPGDRTDTAVFHGEHGDVQVQLQGIGTTSGLYYVSILFVTVGSEKGKPGVYRKGDSIPKTDFTVSRVTSRLVELVAKDEKVILSLTDTKPKPEQPPGAEPAGRGAAQPQR